MKYKIYTPGGNPTLIIENLDNKISRNDYANISNDKMNQFPEIEQVGFMEKGEKTDFRLQMMGGELCINALRCAGKWAYEQTGKLENNIESVGTIFKTFIEEPDLVGIYLPKKYKKEDLVNNLQLITLDGISHFVTTDIIRKDELANQLQFLAEKYSHLLENVSAIGLMVLNKEHITPFVWVKETNSKILETACGSGTLAAYIALDGNKSTFTQPSGFDFFVSEDDDNFVLKSVVG